MAESLIEQLIRHEGLRLFPYLDDAVPPRITIGCGRNLTDCGISDAEAMVLLASDMAAASHDLASFGWFRLLSDARRRALIDLRFNVGPSRFRGFKKMLAALEAGDYQLAAKEMLDSAWHRQVGARAEELARMVETGLLPESDTRSA